MRISNLTERLSIEEEILSHVSKALLIACDAPVEAATATQWLERVRFLLDSFGRHLVRLFSIKEEGGYMEFIAIERRPTLAAEIDRLYAEHQKLPLKLWAIQSDVRATDASNLANLHAIRQRIHGLMARLEEHQTREREILQEGFLTDLGGEG